MGRAQGEKNRQATRDRTGCKDKYNGPQLGTCYVHTVIDDCTRIAYAECHDGERATTAVGVLRRAVAWSAERGVVVERVVSDNGSAYISHLWHHTCANLDITVEKTRPRRPRPSARSNPCAAP